MCAMMEKLRIWSIRIEKRVLGDRVDGAPARCGWRAPGMPAPATGGGAWGHPAFPSEKGTPRGVPFSFRPYFSFFPGQPSLRLDDHPLGLLVAADQQHGRPGFVQALDERGVLLRAGEVGVVDPQDHVARLDAGFRRSALGLFDHDAL